MSKVFDSTSDSRHRWVWIGAAAIAALGTWLMFDASPGINWGIWVTAAALLLVLLTRSLHRLPVIVTAGTASIIAIGASLTADPFMHVLIVLAVIFFLALSMLLSIDPRFERITARFTIPAPVVAFAFAIVAAIRRVVHALDVVRSSRTRSVLRGIAITIPVVAVFALLLSSADPIFARWRDAIDHILSSWEFLPRTIFFLALFTLVLGTYGFASGEEPVPADETAPRAPRRWLGSTEVIILLSSVAILFWTFLAIQVSYLFGSLPVVTGSGMTFAEYARRGFAELTVVASASVLLILFCERFSQRDERRSRQRLVTLALLIAVLFLLGSAIHRVALYEGAYGFTTARLYAQAYMIVVGVALLALAIELRNELDPSRLFRRTFAAATIAFIALLYWNHEAWIADRNIDRLAGNPRFDTVYLTRDLSPNAVPTVVARLRTLPEPARSQLRAALGLRYTGRHHLLEDRWFEWNRGRAAARDALLSAGVSLDYVAPSPVQAAPTPN
jgi:hypothetical protein